MQPLKPIDIPLSGKNLIQASAGTGKTWTLSLLYIRLIIEQQLTVDQLLVVTYTRAATEELRERIRARLKQAVLVYDGTNTAENEYQQLLDCYPVNEERLWGLKRALLSFDEAAVFTIHGFCQRALQENAFEVGLPFDSELIQDEADLQLALADQFWQQRMLEPNPLDQSVLEQVAVTPDSLLAHVRDFIGKPYLQPVRPATVSEEDYANAQRALQRALQRSQALWQQDAQAILATLSPAVMKQTAYKPAQLEAAVMCLETLFKEEWASGKDALKHLTKFTPAYIQTQVKKNQTAPQHPFFEAMTIVLEQLESVQHMRASALDQLRYDLLLWLREKLPARKRQAGLLAFDDLLVNLQDALEARPVLGKALVKQYPVALIDEFQDTDPIQFTVFERIYADSDGRLFYVGDPKQAIYSFRGADINTYLHAARSVPDEQQYTLDRNFRSQPALVDAFNHLFSFSSDPFRNQGRIGYESVQPGGVVDGELTAPHISSPLRIWDWDNGDAEAGVAAVSEQIASAVANDIARLLQEGEQGKANINDQPVSSGDVAVLVRSHRQGRLVKQALQRCGIASVQKSPVGIFETDEALELRAVLAAIAEPSNVGKVRRALVTELMGNTAQQLLTMDEQPLLMEQALEQFYHWHQLWLKQGFMAMLRNWLLRCEVYARLLAYVDGERRMTNLLHLGELIHAETRERWGGMQAVIRWLQQSAEASSSDEERQLRLESDENLVQIVTIHKSKGLQYPVVYCPFLWNEPERKGEHSWFVWYDSEAGVSCLQAGSEQSEAAIAQRRAETLSENLRLLYVALTRAQYHCTVVLASGEIPRFNYRSALFWLLFGHLPEGDKILALNSAMPPAERQQCIHEQLAHLVATGQDTIGWERLPDAEAAVRYQATTDNPPLSARAFLSRIPPIARVGSFSGLASGHHDEQPDYDHTAIDLSAPRPLARQQTSFPGGTRAGVCLHKMLERLDFKKPLEEQHEEVIERSLTEQGFALSWRDAANVLLANTLNTPLLENEALCLRDVAHSMRLDELEFYFSVDNLRADKLRDILLIALPDDWLSIREVVERLEFSDLRGFMKGFVDLIFQWDGKFYVVDYKSNWLGDQPEDYTLDKLHVVMADAHYYLQYLIYCLALHRYLGQRLGNAYRWDEQVGGVLYLFLRGMKPENDGANSRNGIFFHKPEAELIEALDQLMGG